MLPASPFASGAAFAASLSLALPLPPLCLWRCLCRLLASGAAFAASLSLALPLPPPRLWRCLCRLFATGAACQCLPNCEALLLPAGPLLFNKCLHWPGHDPAWQSQAPSRVSAMSALHVTQPPATRTL
eukprot:343648-Chlamydomonas_euryale.AAC.2